MLEWIDYLRITALQAIVTLVAWYFASYVKEKGKNLATREDVHGITQEIESARTQYAKKLEELRAELNTKHHAHTVRFEKEFQVLQEVWRRLIELRNACESFTPGVKLNRPSEAECRERFVEAYYDLLQVIQDQKPFFPQQIFVLLEDYQKRQLRYFDDHEFITGRGFKRDWVSPDFWEKREQNLGEIRNLVDQVCMAIRRSISGLDRQE